MTCIQGMVNITCKLVNTGIPDCESSETIEKEHDKH